jgi:D-alanyl-D-alanine carboxypeptidase
MKKQLANLILFAFLLALPGQIFALELPKNANELAENASLTAKAYVVLDEKTGEVIFSKNANLEWVPASLTKLLTALVVLDTKPKLTKTIAITQADQDAGACSFGGACIKAKPGVKFSVDSLFKAALLPSANNAANALSRSTGLTAQQFAEKMNQKAKSLGAVNSNFVEPTGMSPENKTTASDYSKILRAAFANSYLRGIAGKTSVKIYSANNSKYHQTLKNTNKLLGDSEANAVAAKTGYLDESLYNFASIIKTASGQELAVVILGEEHLYSAFSDTKQLVLLVKAAKDLALLGSGFVAGAITN